MSDCQKSSVASSPLEPRPVTAGTSLCCTLYCTSLVGLPVQLYSLHDSLTCPNQGELQWCNNRINIMIMILSGTLFMKSYKNILDETKADSVSEMMN